MFAGLEPDAAMIDAVGRRARRRGEDRADLELVGPRDLRPLDSDDLFDATVISGEVGLHKPQPEIYLLACERLEVEPAEASSSTTCARTATAPRRSG